jgi:hypothetical protein
MEAFKTPSHGVRFEMELWLLFYGERRRESMRREREKEYNVGILTFSTMG